jgi:hypothetical protein
MTDNPRHNMRDIFAPPTGTDTHREILADGGGESGC